MMRRGDMPEWRAWMSMRQRVRSKHPNHTSSYRDRGITVCEEWENDFLNFYEDMGPMPSGKNSLDRVDNSKGYFKDNCRWANTREQQSNTRRTENAVSKYVGVTFHKGSKKWRARIEIQKEQLNLGLYEEEIEAAEAYKKALSIIENSKDPLNDVKEEFLWVKRKYYSSKYKGVSKLKNGKFCAYIGNGKSRIRLGCFMTENEAYEAVLKKQKELKE
jgi:hypothetical protein